MSFIAALTNIIQHHRERTLETVTAFSKTQDSQRALSFRPGPGRAHAGWQLMHVAITEELFATERLLNQKAGFEDLREHFQRGSVAGDVSPSLAQIQDVLAESRAHLLSALGQLRDADLDTVPEGFLKTRGWTLRKALQVLAWHEPHHQGQAHLTLNIYKAAHEPVA